MLFSACSKKNTNKINLAAEESVKQKVISKSDYKKLKDQSILEKKDLNQTGKLHFIALVKSNALNRISQNILSNDGKIFYQNHKTGYIHFSTSATNTLQLIENNVLDSVAIDRPTTYTPFEVTPEDELLSRRQPSRSSLYPSNLMKANELIEQFRTEHNIELNGSNSTIVIVDTGLDITRTDAFQDRIITVRSLRAGDAAKVTEAKEEIIDEKKYLVATIDNHQVKILRTEKLQADRTYYLGYFSEKNIQVRSRYKKYDLNQDGKDTAIFPVIAFKNDEGIFEAYINVNDVGIYKENGDSSIEDEKKLLDFSWTYENLRDERYVQRESAIQSYYRHTTRLDILKSGRLISDRHKGLVNIAINLEPGFELSKDGSDLKKISPEGAPQNIYQIGIAGFDLDGHGTHCAGIAAGNFETAREFKAPAKAAKIIGISYLGGSALKGTLFDLIHKLIEKHKNVVFNFSFGTDRKLNDTQSTEAKIFDKIAQAYHTAFVKAASNDGPGMNSHGEITSQHMITVANYHNTNSRTTHGTANLIPNKNLLSASSSRGPMIDGALKPDIGAPGWVMSSTAIAAPIGGSTSSFQYWPGTSMAAPNVVSVIALLYDAAIKTSLERPYNDEHLPAVGIDKIHRALKNSALPYDTFTYTECRSPDERSCLEQKKQHHFKWIEGGAGRVNALGAWQLLQEIAQEPTLFFTTQTQSYIQEYDGKAIGHFSLGRLVTSPFIDFQVRLSNDDTQLPNIVNHQRYTLKIPEDIDWLSFHAVNNEKERYLDIFGAESARIRVFVRREQLIDQQKGRLKSGIHSAVLKAYNTQHSEIFDFVFPITIIGSDTQFDSDNDNFQFSVSGFVTADQFVRYFIPVNHKSSAIILDLNVSSSTSPGDLAMQVYHLGTEIPYREMGASSRWAVSSSQYGEGRNRLRYLLHNVPTGMYEVVLFSDSNVNNFLDDIPGSYFNLQASQLSMSIEETKLHSTDQETHVILKDCTNNGSLLRIDKVALEVNKLRRVSNVEVKHQQAVIVPITVSEHSNALKIQTKYYGNNPKMDIDIVLFNSEGAPIAASGGPDSNETITARLAPGQYSLQIAGFAIPTGQATFELSLWQKLKTPSLLSDKFLSSSDEIKLKKAFRWRPQEKYTFRASFKNSELDELPKLEGYSPSISLKIDALYSNDGKTVSIFDQELN